MGLIVQKIGGTSVANAERLRNVAGNHCETYRQGNARWWRFSLCPGDTTDDLIEKAQEINPKASRREMDMLLSTGEQISCSLCAMAVEALGLPVVSLHRLAGWGADQQQLQQRTDQKIDVERIQSEIDQDFTPSSLSPASRGSTSMVTSPPWDGEGLTPPPWPWPRPWADLCQIYTDVDGIYTADPRHVKGARKLEEITFDEMLELASLGAQVLHNRSVELAKKYQVNLEVLSSFERKPGTKVKEVAKNMEKTQISGVATDKNVARLALVGVEDRPGIAYKVFSLLGQKNINVDIIVQSIGKQGTQDISFTVRRSGVDQAVALLQKHKESLPFDHIDVDQSVVKVSIVGA